VCDLGRLTILKAGGEITEVKNPADNKMNFMRRDTQVKPCFHDTQRRQRKTLDQRFRGLRK